MFVPEVLRRIKNADQVEIVCDNAARPHVAVSESAPVLGISRYPRILERRRKGRSSHSSLVENRWESTTPASPRKVACFPSRILDPPETGRSTWVPRGSVAVPENDSIQDTDHSPQQEKMVFTFPSDCLRTPEPSKKKTVSSKPFQKSPTGSTVSLKGRSLDPIFNRWDSAPPVYKQLKNEQPSTVLSLRSCAARTARTLKKTTRGGHITVLIPDKLHKDPDLILSPPKKPIRRGSFESNKEQDSSESSSPLSDTASLLEEALRITAESQYESDPFGTVNEKSNETCDDCQPSLPLALPL